MNIALLVFQEFSKWKQWESLRLKLGIISEYLKK